MVKSRVSCHIQRAGTSWHTDIIYLLRLARLTRYKASGDVQSKLGLHFLAAYAPNNELDIGCYGGSVLRSNLPANCYALQVGSAKATIVLQTPSC